MYQSTILLDTLSNENRIVAIDHMSKIGELNLQNKGFKDISVSMHIVDGVNWLKYT